MASGKWRVDFGYTGAEVIKFSRIRVGKWFIKKVASGLYSQRFLNHFQFYEKLCMNC